MLPNTKTLFHDKPYVESSPLLNDDEDAHYLPAVHNEITLYQRSGFIVSVEFNSYSKTSAYNERSCGNV